MRRLMCLNFLECVNIQYNQNAFPKDELVKIFLTLMGFLPYKHYLNVILQVVNLS